MGWRLDGELERMLRESAQAYLRSAGGPSHARRVREAADGFDPRAWSAMAELGWTGMLLPEDAGGAALGLRAALTLAEELGAALAPEPFVAASVMAATVLAEAGGPGRELARALAAGRRSVALAWQETSGALGPPAFATRLADGRLTGRKVHVAGWSASAALLVAAGGPDGAVVVAVDPAARGVRLSCVRTTDGALEADIAFDAVAVAEDAVLLCGPAAADAVALAVARGTIALAAQLEGLAGALWRLTAEHLKQRRQFGRPLADLQALRHRMVDLYAGIELAAASWRAAAGELEAGETSGVALHAAKARCSDAALEMGRWAIQYHGAFGFTDAADVGLYVHAALRWSSWLGNAAAHRRAALAAHRRRTPPHG